MNNKRRREAVAAFEKAFVEGGYQYSPDNMDNARAWFVHGYLDGTHDTEARASETADSVTSKEQS